MSQEKLLHAQTLIREKRFDEARKVLRSIPENPTAQEWLDKLDEIAPEMKTEPQTSRKSNGGLLIGIVGVVVILVLALALVWVFVLSNDDGDGTGSKVYTDEDLAHAVLTLDDLPSGWSTRSDFEQAINDEVDEADEDFNNPTFCGIELGFDAKTAANATAAFTGGGIAPMLIHAVAAYPGDDANTIFDEFAEKAGACEEWQDEDGVTWYAGEMSFAKFGDESVAFRISTSDVPLVGVMEMQLVIIRDDNLLSIVMYVELGLDGADVEQTESFVRRANEKLKNISG